MNRNSVHYERLAFSLAKQSFVQAQARDAAYDAYWKALNEKLVR